MSDGMDGMGLSYTAVTPRASLQSDAKNIVCICLSYIFQGSGTNIRVEESRLCANVPRLLLLQALYGASQRTHGAHRGLSGWMFWVTFVILTFLPTQLPYWVSYVAFAVATVLLGGLLGLFLVMYPVCILQEMKIASKVCCIDCVYPPRREDSEPSRRYHCSKKDAG